MQIRMTDPPQPLSHPGSSAAGFLQTGTGVLVAVVVASLCWWLSPVRAQGEPVSEAAAAPPDKGAVVGADTDSADLRSVQDQTPDTPRAATGTAPGVRIAQTPDTGPVLPGAPGVPAAPGAPGTGAQPAGPAMPPLPMLLGFADFMITLDRPFEAEKIYGGILAFDPGNEAAKAGMEDVDKAKAMTWTSLGHYYEDTHDVVLYAYGGGPTFRTPYGRVTLTAGTGHYRNNNDPNNRRNPLSLLPTIPTAEDNDTLRKETLNLILEPYYKNYEGNIFLSRVTYDAAPDRWLYDVRLSYVPDPRTRYTVSRGRHDSFFQNVHAQFFAPETYFMVKKRILFDDTSVAIEHPLSERLDFTFAYRYFSYTDGNQRDNFRSQLLYRFRGSPTSPMPVFRAGLDLILDDSKFFTLDYSSSVNFNALSVAADYLWLSRRTKYGVYASYPIAREHFDPPAIFFGFYSTRLSDRHELYMKVGGMYGPRTSLTFGDYVLGINTTF